MTDAAGAQQCKHLRKVNTWFGAHPQYECSDCNVRITYDYASGEVLDEQAI